MVFVYILWSTTYPLTGLLPPETFFRIDPLIMIITSISERLILAGIEICLLMLLLTFILGRFFCGWICPLGTVIDITGRLRRTLEVNDNQNQKIRRTKFFVLAIISLFAILGIQLAWVFDPLVITARFVSLNLIPTLTLTLDAFFSGVITTFGLYGPVYDFYRSLQSSLLGVQIHYFSHSLIILLFFLSIIGVSLYLKRAWCRILCPLGGIYCLVGRFSLLSRTVDNCSQCKICKASCPMGAIKDDLDYVKAECILCMDCIYGCPQESTRFRFPIVKRPAIQGNTEDNTQDMGISRRDFLFLTLISSFSTFSFGAATRKKMRQSVIRPPAALKEEEFLDRCIRCGNCMKVCITNGLQPVLFQAGLSGIWTPQLVPEIGYCEYHCTLCGNVCPTGAIPRLSLEEKKKARLGLAKIDRSICLPWKENKECLVCEEHCPVSDKAIKLKKIKLRNKIIQRPYMNLSLCIGCAICQTKCPTRPKRAIVVYPVRVTHRQSKQRYELKR